MAILIYFLTFILALVIAFFAFIYVRRYLNPMLLIPGLPLKRPIFGDYIEFVNNDCELIKYTKIDRKRFGCIRTSHLFFGKIRLIVTDPVWIKHILSTNSKNYRRGDYVGVENIFLAVGDNGLIVASGERHKRMRKLASPAFKLSQLKKMMPTIEMCAERMVNLIRTRCKENQATSVTEIAVKEILNKTTVDVIGLIAFGHDFKDACSFDENAFGTHLREWMDVGMEMFLILAILPNLIPFKRFLVRMTRYLPLWAQKSPIFKLSRTTNLVHDLVDSIVETKIKEKRQAAHEQLPNDKDSKNLLDFILDACDTTEIYPQEIHDLIMTFIIAGHETTTLSVSWTLYLLTKHPEYQNKCRKEVKKFFEEHQGHVDWDDVHKLTFLTAVINESLRLYPPVPWIVRCPLVNEKIAEYLIPANSEILIILAEMHRMPQHWTNPDEFIPERFLEPHDSIPWEAYMPFGDGVHKCIGYQLGMVETIWFLAVLLNNFEFSIDDSVHYRDHVTITMQPNPPLKLRVRVL